VLAPWSLTGDFTLTQGAFPFRDLPRPDEWSALQDSNLGPLEFDTSRGRTDT